MTTPAEEDGGERTIDLAGPGARGPWVVEVGSPLGASVVTLERGDRLVLGSGAGADVRVHDPAVSGRHATITVQPTAVIVEDLGSKNGVYVAGARVGRAVLTGASCSFVMGRTTLTVRVADHGAEDDVEAGSAPVIEGLVGISRPMRALAHEILRVAMLRCAVLIVGESGSGKDVVARIIHRESRRDGRFVPVNGGAISESLADAELFGHKRGAFTGAVATRAGAFEAAHRGTLFLDEVAELSPAMQVKLLRVIEDQRVRPIGGSEALSVDVRVLSATWAPLRERVAAGRFREDLFHRIATLTLRVPPLRDRPSDMGPLASSLLQRLEDQVGPKELSSAALGALAAYAWPGNVRELAAVLLRAAVATSSTRIEACHVARALPYARPARLRTPSSSDAARLLADNNGNVSAAARAAGVPRSTFRSWLNRKP